MFTLAHFSDPHLPLPPAGLGQLLSKRLTGFLSWQLKRRHIHVPHALAAIVADIRAIAPDHIALTGDIANISLPSEFEQAAEWLASVAPPDRMTVVPGNHDLYVPLAWDASLARWGHYMAGDGRAPPASSDDFPFVRRRGRVALIGLSTAVPTRPLIAQGTLGPGQLDRLGTILADLKREEMFRVVLIHHPPHQGGASRRKGLTDAAGFRAVLARAGAELVLHGHNHRSEIGAIAGPSGNIPVLGVISASASPDSHYGRAGWHRIGIDQAESGAWRITVEHRAIDLRCSGCHVQSTFVFQTGGVIPRAGAGGVSPLADTPDLSEAKRRGRSHEVPAAVISSREVADIESVRPHSPQAQTGVAGLAERSPGTSPSRGKSLEERSA